MVLGTPTTFMPMSEKRLATPSVSSPPTATTAWMLWRSSVSITMRGPSGRLKGLVRLVPSMVPPSWRMPAVLSRVSRKWSSSSSPFQPSRTPTNSKPCCSPRRTTARITALSPGQSPPPVRMATFIRVSPRGRETPSYRGNSPGSRPQARALWAVRAAAPTRGLGRSAPRPAHGHEPQEQLPLGVDAPPGVVAGAEGGRALQPHANPDQPAVGEGRQHLRRRGGQVAAPQGADAALVAVPRQPRVPPPPVEGTVEPRRDVVQLVEHGVDPLRRGGGDEPQRPQGHHVEDLAPLEVDEGLVASAALGAPGLLEGGRPDGGPGGAAGLAGHHQDAAGPQVGQLGEALRRVADEPLHRQRHVGADRHAAPISRTGAARRGAA